MYKKSKYDIGFRFAAAGINAALKGRNFRIQAAIGALAVILGFFLQIDQYEYLAVLIVSGLVLACEAFNSAIEVLCDFICSERNDNIKKVKDISAGAVLISSGFAFMTGLIIFLPKIWTLAFGGTEV